MPRKGRGGSRQGSPGTAYANRSDLNAPKTVPITRFTGQEYGQQTQQVQAQQAVPVSAPPAPQGQTPADAALAHPWPALTPMGAPTDRPGEPVTAGMAMGPGAGPESLAPLAGGNQTPTQADLERMRTVLPSLEKIADLGDSSDVFRAYVRQLRGQIRTT